MYLKQVTKNGVTRLYFYESYYEKNTEKGKKGRIKHRVIQSLGNLDELKKSHDDPIGHFTKLAKQLTEEKKAANRATITLDFAATMQPGDSNNFNVGYGVLKALYKELELDKFWRLKAREKKIKYDLELIFKLLVFSRALFPGSKKDTFKNKKIYFERMNGFSHDDLYHSLDLIDEHHLEMQKWIYARSGNIVKRDLSATYFDCTNYYFDIGKSDLDTFDDAGNPVDKHGNSTEIKYRKRGPEKNHRPDPIVNMGLLMDRNKIPLAYDLFPGNESEKLHLRPILDRIKNEFTDSRVIIVADRGLNTSDNIYFLNGNNKCDYNTRDGYVYGQSVRGACEEFKKWVLGDGYTTTIIENDEGNEITFKHKSRIYPKS